MAADEHQMQRGERDAFESALGAIKRRERSTAEIVGWLAERDHGPEAIEAAITQLIEYGELDDERFAHQYAADKRELAGWGPERIAAALRDRGIERDLLERVCADEHGAQVERAMGLIEARRLPLGDDQERARALGLLARRGYGSEVAHEAIRRADPGVGGLDAA